MRLALVLVSSLVALTGCTSNGDSASGNPAAEPSADPAGSAAAALTAEVLEGDEVPDPLATITGELPLLRGGSPVVVDILQVRASDTSTLLRWRLRSPNEERVDTYTSALSLPNRFDTRGVELVDDRGGQRLQPYTYVPQANDNPISCVCSQLPNEVGEAGVLMYALYPALDPATKALDVTVPGLEVAQDVPVERS